MMDLKLATTSIAFLALAGCSAAPVHEVAISSRSVALRRPGSIETRRLPADLDLRPCSGWAQSIALSSDGSITALGLDTDLVIARGDEGPRKIAHSETLGLGGVPGTRGPPEDPIDNVVVTDDGGVLTWRQSGLEVWTRDGRSRLACSRKRDLLTAPSYAPAPGARDIAIVSSANRVEILGVATNATRDLGSLDASPTAIAWSPRASLLAVGTDVGLVRVFAKANARLVTSFAAPGTPARSFAVTAIAISPDDDRIATATVDGLVTIRSLATATVARTFSWPRATKTRRLAFAADGRLAAFDDVGLAVWPADRNGPPATWSYDALPLTASYEAP
jgi:WD40 repeat protein